MLQPEPRTPAGPWPVAPCRARRCGAAGDAQLQLRGLGVGLILHHISLLLVGTRGCSEAIQFSSPNWSLIQLPNGIIMMKNPTCGTWALSLQREFELGLFSRIQPGVFPLTDVLALCLAKKHTAKEHQALTYH